MVTPNIPLWEVFIRSRNGLAHKHVGSLHATDATLALQAARDIYTRRGEGLSIWVVPSNAITASDPSEKGMMFEPAPTFDDEWLAQVRRRAAPSRTMVLEPIRPHPEELAKQASRRMAAGMCHPSRRAFDAPHDRLSKWISGAE